MSAMAISKESIPIKVTDAFTTVELISSVLNICPQRREFGFILSREARLDLLLERRNYTDEKFVGVVVGTGIDRFLDELVQFIRKLNGYLGHDGWIVSNQARFVEGLNQRSESSSLTCCSRWRSAVSMASLACGSRRALTVAMHVPSL